MTVHTRPSSLLVGGIPAQHAHISLSVKFIFVVGLSRGFCLLASHAAHVRVSHCALRLRPPLSGGFPVSWSRVIPTLVYFVLAEQVFQWFLRKAVLMRNLSEILAVLKCILLPHTG